MRRGVEKLADEPTEEDPTAGITAEIPEEEEIAEEPTEDEVKCTRVVVVERVRREMNIELNHPPNLERLVLGCIDADFCK